jgi:DNA mismatch endonuclease, patch repair protein
MTGSPVALNSAVRAQMQRLPRRDTQPELRLRRALHQRGYRYRVDLAPLTGLRRKADVVFTRRRVVVFVDGCFWHKCPLHCRQPTHNAAWWATKLSRTAARDLDTTQRLAEAGWTVVRLWEHEPLDDAVAKVEAALALHQ